jgi:hypothetical protein
MGINSQIRLRLREMDIAGTGHRYEKNMHAQNTCRVQHKELMRTLCYIFNSIQLVDLESD